MASSPGFSEAVLIHQAPEIHQRRPRTPGHCPYHPSSWRWNHSSGRSSAGTAWTIASLTLSWADVPPGLLAARSSSRLRRHYRYLPAHGHGIERAVGKSVRAMISLARGPARPAGREQRAPAKPRRPMRKLTRSRPTDTGHRASLRRSLRRRQRTLPGGHAKLIPDQPGPAVHGGSPSADQRARTRNGSR